MPKLIFIFLDGVGVGKPEDSNPFYMAKSRYLPLSTGENTLPDGTTIKSIDPLLGIDGLPQSATGQTTLFTGSNIPFMLNGHWGSYPNRPMRKIIKNGNLLSFLNQNHINSKYINAYPGHSNLFSTKHIKIQEDGHFYFSDVFPVSYKKKISTTSCMMIANEVTPCDETDILSGRALYQDFTNQSLIKRGFKLPEFTPLRAAKIIYNISKKHDFILYEYFQTDLYGHRRSFLDCVELIKQLDRMIEHLTALLDKKRDTLLITSDHGNIEDYSTRSHTLNPVPLLVWGNKNEKLKQSINSIVDVTPSILEFF